MITLRQSTAATLVVGPLVDATDGVTPETGVTLAAADAAEIVKHEAATVTDISGRTFAALAGADGFYTLALTGTDTETAGRLSLVIADADVCRPVRMDAMVMPAARFDALYGTGDLTVDAAKLAGSTVAADNLAAGTLGLVTATAGSGSTTTKVVSDLSETTNDHYNGRTLVFTSGALQGQAAAVTDYVGATKELTVTALTEAPTVGDGFILV